MFQESRNAWVIGEADQVAFLIDAAAYYESLLSHLRRAERSIFILGWDIDSRIQLVPGAGGCPSLAALLNQLVGDKPDLHIYLLLWDFSNIYLFGREAFQSIKFGLNTDARIHFRFDNEHPISASHHQKIVVIDDTVAFCGGIDLTGNRWDTDRHLPHDPLRINPAGQMYAPFHDVQMAVTGPPALWLGRLCRDRWQRATGVALSRKVELAPKKVALCAASPRKVPIAISRTLPAYKQQKEVREVEQLFLDMIDEAKDFVYIENQYFTSAVVCRHLCASLERSIGPEVVIILPKLQDSWLAKITMGAPSMKCILAMLDSDRYGRLQVYYPEDRRLSDGQYINVHSKVMIVDGIYARVGSANLNNRSMGLDTECDLTVDGSGRPDVQALIRRFLCDLLADHLGQTGVAVAARLTPGSTLREVINFYSVVSSQTLEKYVCPTSVTPVEAMVGEMDVMDLDRTAKLEKAMDEFVFGEATRRIWLPERVPVAFFLALVLCFTLAGMFALASDISTVKASMQSIVGYAPASFLEGGVLVIAMFVVGGLLFVPLNLMIVATASVFRGDIALLLILLGAMASAMVGYLSGFLLRGVANRSALHRAFHSCSQILQELTQRRSSLSVFLVRIFPLAPFALINLLAGVGGIRLRAYAWGTFFGLLPGAISLVVFQRSLLGLIRNPGPDSLLLFVLVTLLVTQLFQFLSRRFGGRLERRLYA